MLSKYIKNYQNRVIFPGLVLPKCAYFYFSGLSTSKMRCVFGSTKPGKTSPRVKLIAGERWPTFTFFIFPGTVLPFCYFSRAHFGSTVPGKTSPRVKLIAGERSSTYRGRALQRWPNITFFYFSGYSTSIFLFFRSTESPGKTRSVFTPPSKHSCINFCFKLFLLPFFQIF